MSESERHVRERLLKQFNFNETDNIAGSLFVPLQTGFATPLASINLDQINSNDRVELRASVGWQVSATLLVLNPQIQFSIVRDQPNGVTVFTTTDTANVLISTGQRFNTQMFHAEKGLNSGGHSYTLNAQVVAPGLDNQLAVVGPVNLSGSVIDENDT